MLINGNAFTGTCYLDFNWYMEKDEAPSERNLNVCILTVCYRLSSAPLYT